MDRATDRSHPGIDGASVANSADAAHETKQPTASEFFQPRCFALLLGLLLFAKFSGALLGTNSFFLKDYGVFSYPFAFYHRECFWRGELPLWNPLIDCGIPFLAQWTTLTLYPGSLIYLLLPLPWGLNIFCIAHLFLAGMGTYFLALRWTKNRFAPSFAGIAYVFSGTVLSSMMWPHYLVAIGWMPWVVLATDRAWDERGRSVVWAAFAGAMQMMSGAPELILMTWLLVGLLWCARAIGCSPLNPTRNLDLTLPKDSASKITIKIKIKSGLTLLAVVVLIAALSAVQLLPFLDLLSHSQRDTGYAIARWAMPLSGLGNFLVPLFQTRLSPQGFFYQPDQQFLLSYFPGIIVVVLAVAAVFWRRDRLVSVLAIAAIASLVFALGENGYVYGWIRRIVPQIGFARYTIKAVELTAFALPLLAAVALDRFESSAFRYARSLMFLAGGTVALMGGLLWWSQSHSGGAEEWNALWRNTSIRVLFFVLASGLMVAARSVFNSRVQILLRCTVLLLVAFDLATHAPNITPTLPAARFLPGLWQANATNAAPKLGESRAMVSAEAESRLVRSRVDDFSSDFLGKRVALFANLNLLEGIPKVNGFPSLQPREQDDIEALLYRSPGVEYPALMDFLGVSVASTRSNILDWTSRTTALPLITAGQKPVFIESKAILLAIASPQFRPRDEVYFPRELESKISVRNSSTVTVESKRMTAHHIEATTTASEAALLIVAQTFYYPWRATIDGQAVPLLRANHAFQAVEIPAGTHIVTLTYRDRRFFVGAAISLLALAACFGYLFLTRKQNQTKEDL